MTALLAAFSLQDKIEQYGAYAGIGAIFGLGVLSLLYFAQAREVKRLREWAGRAPERAAELEARVAADAQRRLTHPPVSPTAPATPAAAQQSAAPAAPGAPATAAAAAGAAGVATTVAKPATTAPQNGTGSGAAVPPPTKPGEEKAGGEDGKGGETPSGAPGTTPAGAPGATPAGAPGATPAGAPGTTPAGQPGAATPQPVAREGQSPPAATPAGQPGAATPQPAAPEGQPPAGQTGTSPQPAGRESPPAPATPAGQPRPGTPAAAAARPAAPLRAPTTSTALPPRTPAGARPRTTDDDGGRSRGRLAAIVGAGLAVVAALAVAGILIFGGGDGDEPASKPNKVAPPSSSASPNANGGSSSAKKAAPKIDRGSITVSVLNGTTVTGLARSAADKVTGKGYREGVVTNDSTNQQRRVTQIFYEASGKAAALDLAKLLSVQAVNVKPMDANARVLADRAQVAVFVGADKAQ